MTATGVRETPIELPGSKRAVVLALARAELTRSLRHPVIWLGAVFSLWLMWTSVGDVAPILERDSIALAGAMLPLAAATLLVAFQAVTRDRDSTELLEGLPHSRDQRAQGIQVSVLGLAGLAALLQLFGLVYLLLGDPIGSINWGELAVGPMAVVVGGAAGVLLGRRMPHPMVAPVALVAFGMLQILAAPDLGADMPDAIPTVHLEWLAAWIAPSAFEPLELIANRPHIQHLLYLVALTAVFTIWGWRASGVGFAMRTAVSAAFLTTVVVVSTSAPDHNPFRWLEAAENQICEAHLEIEFCAFELYEEWIPRWQAVVDEMSRVAPVDIDIVLQRPVTSGWGEELPQDQVIALAGVSWDRPGRPEREAFHLARTVAIGSVGLPTQAIERPWTDEEIAEVIEQNPHMPDDWADTLREETTPMGCSASGQARAVVSLWMAAAATPGGPELVDRYLAGDRIFWPAHWIWVGIDDASFTMARAMLDLPNHQVSTELGQRWDQVLDPGTTSADLASWFGIPAPDHTTETDSGFREQCT